MIAEVQPIVYFGPPEPEAMTMLMIGDTSISNPIIDSFPGRMIRVISSEFINIHPFIRKWMESKLLLDQFSQFSDVFTELD